MKHSNWKGICRSFVEDLPHGRAYSKVEAAYSLQWDYFHRKQATISGYADLWQWSRNKVRNFLTELGIVIIYPEDTTIKRKQKGTLTLLAVSKKEKGHKKRIINSQLEVVGDMKNKNEIEKGHKKRHKKDIKRTLKGQEESNKNSKLNDDGDIKRTLEGHKKDIRKDTTIESKEEIREKEKKKIYKKTKMTLNFLLSDKFKEYAIRKGIAEKDILSMFIDFKEYHKEKGESREKWILSWHTWVRNKIKWGYSSNNKPKIIPRSNDIPERGRRGSEQYKQEEIVVNL